MTLRLRVRLGGRGHVRAIEAWVGIQAAADPEGVDAGRSPITNSFAWVTAA